MTSKELKKLNRRELLEMLIVQMQENEQLRNEIAKKDKQLAERRIAIKNAGNIAQASLELNKVFEAAQAAADQYLENVKRGGVVADKTAYTSPFSSKTSNDKPKTKLNQVFKALKKLGGKKHK